MIKLTKQYECTCDLCGSFRAVDDSFVAEHIMVKVYVVEKNKEFHVCQMCARTIHEKVPQMAWFKPEKAKKG